MSLGATDVTITNGMVFELNKWCLKNCVDESAFLKALGVLSQINVDVSKLEVLNFTRRIDTLKGKVRGFAKLKFTSLVGQQIQDYMRLEFRVTVSTKDQPRILQERVQIQGSQSTVEKENEGLKKEFEWVNQLWQSEVQNVGVQQGIVVSTQKQMKDIQAQNDRLRDEIKSLKEEAWEHKRNTYKREQRKKTKISELEGKVHSLEEQGSIMEKQVEELKVQKRCSDFQA